MPLTVRPAQARDLPALLRSLQPDHATDADATSGATLERFAAWLQAAPDGCRVWIGEDEHGLAAHLCAVPRATRVGGDTRLFTELIGAWISPRRRTGLHRGAALCGVAAALFEAHQGVAGDFVYHTRAALPARRLAHARLEHKPVGTLPLLHFALRSAAAMSTPDVAPAARFDARFTDLFARCVGDLGAATVRDERFLQHRFADHPAGGFTTLTCRDGDALRGYAVLRRATTHAGTWLLWDWLVPNADEDAGRQLAHAACEHAREKGATALAGFVPETSVWFERLQDHGARVRAWPPFVFARTSARRYDAHWLHEHWWHTLADTVLEPAVAGVEVTR